MAFAMLVMAAGSIVMTIPQWTVGPYELGEVKSDKCLPAGKIHFILISVTVESETVVLQKKVI